MHRLVVLGIGIGLITAAGCRDRNRHDKRAPAGSAAGSGNGGAAAPAMPASYARLVGDKPATLGSALATLRFGEPVDDKAVPEVPATSFGFLGEAEPRIVRRASGAGAEPKVLVNLEIRADKLFAFRIELLTAKGSIPADGCAGFARGLEAAWGPAPERVWVDRGAHVRAALRDTCVLVFERYADVASWIGPDASSVVPVSLIGKAPSALGHRVGSHVGLREDFTFRDVGVGDHASGPTVMDVYLHEGTIIGVGAETPAAAADRAAIRERISSAFEAKPTRDAVTGYDTWATTVPIRMLETPSGVRVEVGHLTP